MHRAAAALLALAVFLGGGGAMLSPASPLYAAPVAADPALALFY
jgi:hypothetical protein